MRSLVHSTLCPFNTRCFWQSSKPFIAFWKISTNILVKHWERESKARIKVSIVPSHNQSVIYTTKEWRLQGARRACLRGKKGMFLNVVRPLLHPWRASIGFKPIENYLQVHHFLRLLSYRLSFFLPVVYCCVNTYLVMCDTFSKILIDVSQWLHSTQLWKGQVCTFRLTTSVSSTHPFFLWEKKP